ncbi:MAG: DRTGG domain-containing protein, partial [Dehalococcoidia bacterium]
GKTVLSAALAGRWQKADKKVEYLKPNCVRASSDESALQDEEYLFSRRALGLKDPPQPDAPITLIADNLDDPSLAEARSRVEALCQEAAVGADVLLVEASGGLREGGPGRRLSPDICQALQAKALLVVRYSRDLEMEQVVSAAEPFGKALLGVVINAVPQMSWRMASTSFGPSLRDAGLRVLGLLPESRALLGISVQDLVERLRGRYALKINGSEELIENVMVGANVLDAPGHPAGPAYFGLKENKAVITRGDRPDIQWAALDTPTRCIILTGNHEPIPYVTEKAREREVPLVVVEQDTLDTLDAVEEVLAAPRFDLGRKLQSFQALVEENLDLADLDSSLDL